MATRFVNDNEYAGPNIEPSYLVEWQVFIVNPQSSSQLLIAGSDDTLPPLTIITENYIENKDILFTCNLTFRGLNKAIFIHWGDQLLFDVPYIHIDQYLSIEVEQESKNVIILHPKCQQQLMKIDYNLRNNSEYSDKTWNPDNIMVDQV